MKKKLPIFTIMVMFVTLPNLCNAQFNSYKYEPTYSKMSDSDIELTAQIAKENKYLLTVNIRIMKLFLGIKSDVEVTSVPQSDEILRKEFKNILDFAEKLPKDYKIAYHTKDVSLVDKLVLKALDEFEKRTN